MIHNISLAEVLEQYSPPAKVLNVGALDDTVFVRICEVDQDHKSETHREVAEISVSLPALIEALALLAGDGEREELRPLDSDGKTRETRLAGRRVIVAGTSPYSLTAALKDHLRHSALPGNAAADDTSPPVASPDGDGGRDGEP